MKSNSFEKSEFNLNEYLNNSELNSAGKAIFFYNVLLRGGQLKQQDPEQFSDIYICNHFEPDSAKPSQRLSNSFSSPSYSGI